MMFVFAYVDIFGFFRSDVLKAALDGKAATTGFEVNLVFLTFALIYILRAVLMVVLSLLLTPPVNRIVNIVVSALYIITIIVAAVGEKWFYYLIGSFVEVILLVAIAGIAWKWPPPQSAPQIAPSVP